MASTSHSASVSDPQRRSGARFSRALIEPPRAAALLAQSPVNPDVLPLPEPSVGSSPMCVAGSSRLLLPTHQRSTPQPVRRSLFSKLFRLKQESVSAAASPASSHQSTPTRHDERIQEFQAETNMSHSMPDFTRAVSMPVAGKRAVGRQVETEPAIVSPSEADMVSGKLLLDGPLVKLSSHRYWHAKATYFHLDEQMTASEARSRITLRQFRKKPHKDQSEVPLAELELTEFDVVVDISDRYIKHGLELFHRGAITTPGEPSQKHGRTDGGEELLSLRLSAEDASSHRKWMRVLGTAIARLIDQSKRHYPITPADVEFARGALKAFEPQAVTAIVETSIPVKGSTAKVRPMVSSSSGSSCNSSGDESNVAAAAEENQRDDARDCGERVDEMRDPEEPELHSDIDDANGQRSSLSAISDEFSGAWASPHHQQHQQLDNNDTTGYASDDNNHERSSNQYDEEEEDNNQLRYEASASRAGYTTASVVHPSPSGTDSVASSLSPPSMGGYQLRPSDESDESLLANLADAMAAASMTNNMDDSINTPLVSPQRQQGKPQYTRHHPLSASSRLGGPLARPQMHSFNANGQVFTLDARYRLIKSIGNGAYGAVIAAADEIAERSVAVKKITNIFDDLVDAKRILREVRLLRHFHHKNITELLDLAPPLTKKSFEDMYIVTELMETDLHQVIYSTQPMSDDHVKYFLYQMLCALYHIHSAGVLHRDMKPSNILLNSNCDLKVCDFGLARGGMDPEADAKRLAKPGELTEYVVTRWYRAPEIMLNCLQYTAAVDVWAVGCIFAEMLLREPLFPGNDYMHQLKLIIEFLGTPKQDDISFIKNAKALRFLTKLSIFKPKKWRELFAGDELNPLALDLLAQMLIFNPEKRISVEKALQHPYLATFHDAADITRASPFSFEFDLPDDALTKDALVDLLCEDVACFHPVLMQAMSKPPPPLASVPLPKLRRPTAATHDGGNRYFGTMASAS